MKTKFSKNLIFLIGVFFVISSVMLFNFIVDPYFVFRNKDHMDLNFISHDYYHAMIKAYKNNYCDTVIIGSSSASSLFLLWHYYKYYFNLLCLDDFSYKEQFYLLKDYLHFHPETKNVYIFLCYPSFFEKGAKPKSELKGESFNLRELMYILFSVKTIKNSLEKFKREKKINLRESTYLIEENPVFNFNHFPNIMPVSSVDEKSREEYKKLNMEYLKKITDYLKQNKINFNIVILPYHGIFQAILYNNHSMQNTIEELKRFCVKISDNDVYDFSIINKYTTSDYEYNNYLYTDLIHPNYVLGSKVFKVLHDNISENNLYVKLNKNNIEKQINIQNELIDNYCIKNKALIDKYIHFYENNPNVDLMKMEVKNFEGAPDYVTQELDLYRKKFKKIHEIYRQGKEIKKGVWENQI